MTGHYSCWTSESINFKVVGPGGSTRQGRGSNNYGSLAGVSGAKFLCDQISIVMLGRE